jgi:hypothetical protein
MNLWTVFGGQLMNNPCNVDGSTTGTGDGVRRTPRVGDPGGADAPTDAASVSTDGDAERALASSALFEEKRRENMGEKVKGGEKKSVGAPNTSKRKLRGA